MGTDIHMYAEEKVNGVWEEVPELDSIYDERNYTTFGVLAGVRLPDTKGLVCISSPKGLPHDISSDVLRESENCDSHSHSFLTLAELLEFNWEANFLVYRNVDMQGYQKFKKGLNYSSCGLFSGKYKFKSNAEMDRLYEDERRQLCHVDAGVIDLGAYSYYTTVGVEESHLDACYYFVNSVIPKLCKRIRSSNTLLPAESSENPLPEETGNPKDIRIVFWFDS